ncbi:uncharacterized protein C17orf98 homolog [Oncorhynchus tshawytscha]|uniref:uncharacterized protein C17orf98 homolog n=1 Tax=Oncorhynchus tshawytscha TaxID=74940 RepID=UPI001C3D91DF|nr:uncharacterized protein C17orf98 homolog [Oncorhynchus tshawytscha]
MNHSGPEKREQKFVLDCIAVSSIALGYEHMRPRLWSVLPGYDARNDPHAARYTTTPSVQRVPKKTTPSVQRVPQKTTPSVRRVPQKTENKELKSAAAQKSLDLRNTSGAGHSREQVSNHSGLMSDNKPLIGYNGRFGFRRNTPNLRRNPSSFGEVTTFQLH